MSLLALVVGVVLVAGCVLVVVTVGVVVINGVLWSCLVCDMWQHHWQVLR